MSNEILRTFLLLLLLAAPAAAESPTREPVPVAVLVPLTGPAAIPGAWVVEGIEVAQAELESSGGPVFDLKTDDTQGDPKRAVEAFRNVASRFRLQAALSWGSGVGIALTPIVNSAKILHFGVATGTAKYSTKGDYTFRLFQTNEQEADFLSARLTPEMLSKLAVVWIANDYGVGIGERVVQNVRKKGVEPLLVEEFHPGTNDFRSLIGKMKRKGVETIVISTYPGEGAIFLKNAYEMQFGKRILAGGALLDGGGTLEQLGAAAENISVSLRWTGDAPSSQDRFAHFARQYEKQFGRPITPDNSLSVNSYDAMHLLGQAIQSCSNENKSECVRDRIAAVRNYSGASGMISFDENGDIDAEFRFVTVRDGRIVPE